MSWAGQLDLGALPWNLGPFLQREYPRAGRKEVGRGRKREEGERMGQAPAGSEFSLGLAKKRGHLDWPGGSYWLGLRCVCGSGGGGQEKRMDVLVCVPGTRTSFLGWMGAKRNVKCHWGLEHSRCVLPVSPSSLTCLSEL